MRESAEEISRREFLRTGVSAGSFLAEFLIPKEVRAQIEKMINRERPLIPTTFEGTIQHLKKDVYEKKTEEQWIFLHKGDTQGMLSIKRRASSQETESISLEHLFADAGVQEVIFFHTHPVVSYKHFGVPDKEISEIREKRKSSYLLVPSGVDMAAQIQTEVHKQAKTKIRHIAVDPVGMWEYQVNLQHPEIRRFLGNIPKDLSYFTRKNLDLVAADIDRDMRVFQAAALYPGALPELVVMQMQKKLQSKWGITLKFTKY